MTKALERRDLEELSRSSGPRMKGISSFNETILMAHYETFCYSTGTEFGVGVAKVIMSHYFVSR